MDTRERVHAFLALMERARKEVLPKYKDAIRNHVRTMRDGGAVQAALAYDLQILFACAPPATECWPYNHIMRQWAMAAFDYKCAYCEKPIVATLFPYGGRADQEFYRPVMHWDHVHPKRLGGLLSYTNLVPACPKCNLGKLAKPLGVWRPPGT